MFGRPTRGGSCGQFTIRAKENGKIDVEFNEIHNEHQQILTKCINQE